MKRIWERVQKYWDCDITQYAHRCAACTSCEDSAVHRSKLENRFTSTAIREDLSSPWMFVSEVTLRRSADMLHDTVKVDNRFAWRKLMLRALSAAWLLISTNLFRSSGDGSF